MPLTIIELKTLTERINQSLVKPLQARRKRKSDEPAAADAVKNTVPTEKAKKIEQRHVDLYQEIMQLKLAEIALLKVDSEGVNAIQAFCLACASLAERFSTGEKDKGYEKNSYELYKNAVIYIERLGMNVDQIVVERLIYNCMSMLFSTARIDSDGRRNSPIFFSDFPQLACRAFIFHQAQKQSEYSFKSALLFVQVLRYYHLKKFIINDFANLRNAAWFIRELNFDQLNLLNQRLSNPELIPIDCAEALIALLPEAPQAQEKARALIANSNEAAKRMGACVANADPRFLEGLYPTQKEVIRNFATHLNSGSTCAYYVQATGTGKTEVMGAMINCVQQAAEKRKIAIVAPSIALVGQTAKRIERLAKSKGLDLAVAKYTEEKKCLTADVVVTTMQTLVGQLKKEKATGNQIASYELVIIDEVHTCLTFNLIDLITHCSNNAIIVGCTATPTYNTERNKYGSLASVHELFGEANKIFDYPIMRAIDDKVLCPVQNYIVKIQDEGVNSLRRQDQINSGDDGDFKITQEAEAILSDDTLNRAVAEIYSNLLHPITQQRMFGQQAIISCVAVKHAKAIAACLNKLFANDPAFRGKIIAEDLCGDLTEKKQKEALERFQKGETVILCGAILVGVGLDNPFATILINVRPSRSQVLVQQRNGRVLRKLPAEAPGIKAAVVVDLDLIDGQIDMADFTNGQSSYGYTPSPDALITYPVDDQRFRRVAGAMLWQIGTSREAIDSLPVRANPQPDIRPDVVISAAAIPDLMAFTAEWPSHYAAMDAPMYPAQANAYGSDSYDCAVVTAPGERAGLTGDFASDLMAMSDEDLFAAVRMMNSNATTASVDSTPFAEERDAKKHCAEPAQTLDRDMASAQAARARGLFAQQTPQAAQPQQALLFRGASLRPFK